MRILISIASGALFGVGLVISGMTNTQKVQGFLDIFGSWDITLAFVMGGAMLPMIFAWLYSEKTTPLYAEHFPERRSDMGRGLVVGSVLFGIGWGLAGLCPGPAIASLSFGGAQGLVFVAAMAAGMLVNTRLRPFVERAPEPL